MAFGSVLFDLFWSPEVHWSAIGEVGSFWTACPSALARLAGVVPKAAGFGPTIARANVVMQKRLTGRSSGSSLVSQAMVPTAKGLVATAKDMDARTRTVAAVAGVEGKAKCTRSGTNTTVEARQFPAFQTRE